MRVTIPRVQDRNRLLYVYYIYNDVHKLYIDFLNIILF